MCEREREGLLMYIFGQKVLVRVYVDCGLESEGPGLSNTRLGVEGVHLSPFLLYALRL